MNIIMIKKLKENYILKEYQNLKENFYIIKNGMEKDMIYMEMYHMN